MIMRETPLQHLLRTGSELCIHVRASCFLLLLLLHTTFAALLHTRSSHLRSFRLHARPSHVPRAQFRHVGGREGSQRPKCLRLNGTHLKMDDQLEMTPSRSRDGWPISS